MIDLQFGLPKFTVRQLPDVKLLVLLVADVKYAVQIIDELAVNLNDIRGKPDDLIFKIVHMSRTDIRSIEDKRGGIDNVIRENPTPVVEFGCIWRQDRRIRIVHKRGDDGFDLRNLVFKTLDPSSNADVISHELP